MAAWLIPALKTILPHIGTIIVAAKPVFTTRNTGVDANQTTLLQQQISELQSAASRNAESTKALAAQLQGTVVALEQAAAIAESKLRRVYVLSVLASAASLVAICIALFGVFNL